MATTKIPKKETSTVAADKNATSQTAPVKKTAPAAKAQESKQAVKPAAKDLKTTPKSSKTPGTTVAAPQQELAPAAAQTPDGKWGEIRQLLLNLKEQTLLEIKRSIKKGSEATVGEEPTGDIYDQASSERDRELGLLLNDRERQKLHNIDDALLRIAEDEYGICEECDEDIPLGRLKVLPFTRHCVKCKSELEKIQAQTRRLEEDRVYREIPVGDDDEG
jgi:DnaK suppressor protein